MEKRRIFLGIILVATIWSYGCTSQQYEIVPPHQPTLVPVVHSPSPKPTPPAVSPAVSPTPDYVRKEQPKSLQWVEKNAAGMFTDADMGFDAIALDMERGNALHILGQPFTSEDIWDDARGYPFRIDRYENGDFYIYLLVDEAYRLYEAVQRSGLWMGPRSLSIGDSVDEVLSAFSYRSDDMVMDGYSERVVVLYGLYPENHDPNGRPCAPCGYIVESKDYFLGWERYEDDEVYQFHYEFCSEDDPLYHKVLAGEQEYMALGEFYCVFTIRDGLVIAMEWGRDLGAA